MNALMRGLVATVIVLAQPVSDANAATYLFHNDHLGTPQVLTDSDQQVVWQSEQDPFGEVEEVVSVVEQNLRFPGQYFDVETALHYNYYRTYDPRVGRYIASDPIGITYDYSLLYIPLEHLEKKINLSVNRNEPNRLYGYVEQNPLKKSDAYGLGSEGTPGNNIAQNKQVKDICRELQLNRSERRILHDHITGDNLGYHDIRFIAIDLFGFPSQR